MCFMFEERIESGRKKRSTLTAHEANGSGILRQIIELNIHKLLIQAHPHNGKNT